MSEFDFGTLEVIIVPVTGPDKKHYVLVEASEDSVARFNNKRAQCVRFEGGEMSAVDGQGDLEPYLVSLCLFKVKEPYDPENKDTWKPDPDGAVPLNTVRAWPGRVIRPLFDKAKEISEIDDLTDLPALRKERDRINKLIAKIEEQPSKNVPEAAPTGSELPPTSVSILGSS